MQTALLSIPVSERDSLKKQSILSTLFRCHKSLSYPRIFIFIPLLVVGLLLFETSIGHAYVRHSDLMLDTYRVPGGGNTPISDTATIAANKAHTNTDKNSATENT